MFEISIKIIREIFGQIREKSGKSQGNFFGWLAGHPARR